MRFLGINSLKILFQGKNYGKDFNGEINLKNIRRKNKRKKIKNLKKTLKIDKKFSNLKFSP
jgi:hypothetical protein